MFKNKEGLSPPFLYLSWKYDSILSQYYNLYLGGWRCSQGS